MKKSIRLRWALAVNALIVVLEIVAKVAQESFEKENVL